MVRTFTACNQITVLRLSGYPNCPSSDSAEDLWALAKLIFRQGKRLEVHCSMALAR